MKISTFAPVLTVLVAVAVFVGCEKRDASVPESRPVAADSVPRAIDPAPMPNELENATYRGFQIVKESVTLAGGRWEGEPETAGSAARPQIVLARDFRLVGDLDADGADEAVVLLSESGGGTGHWDYVAVVDRQAGELRNIATALLGDRVQVRDARIEDGRILVDLVQAGSQDAMCCPGELVTRGWHLRPGGLEEFVTSSKSGRLSLATLGGSEWVLRRWSWDEAAGATPAVTLAFEDGKFVGKSGCNRYFAPATDGEMPGDASVGPAGATRMSCPEPAMQVEDRFLKQLAAVKKYGFVAGQLALSYQSGDTLGVMLFERRALPAVGAP